jgi:hypothetical protein
MSEPYEYDPTLDIDAPYGYCPDCGAPLQNWGAHSDGDGDIYDAIGCPECEEVKEKRHATYCHCQLCDPYGYTLDETEPCAA